MDVLSAAFTPDQMQSSHLPGRSGYAASDRGVSSSVTPIGTGAAAPAMGSRVVAALTSEQDTVGPVLTSFL